MKMLKLISYVVKCDGKMPRDHFQSLREMPRHFAKCLNCLDISRNAGLHRLPVTYALFQVN